MTMTDDMIQHALNKDYNKANQIFQDIMGAKVNDMLDQEKIRLADQIYNGAEPDEEQLELDLEDEQEEDDEQDMGQTPSEAEMGEEGISEPDSDVEIGVGDEDGDDTES